MKIVNSFNDGIQVGIILGIAIGFLFWILYVSQLGYTYTKSNTKIPPYEIMEKKVLGNDTLYTFKIFLN